MTLVKCPNGHYYDSSRFGNNCPHCGMSGAASIGADQTTVPLNIPDAPQPANEVTEPLTASQPVVSQPANVTAPTVSDDDRTLPVTADMLDGMAEKPAPVVGWLVCTDGVNKGTDYRLHQGRNFIGRSPEMDVCILGDNTVSRSSHAKVTQDTSMSSIHCPNRSGSPAQSHGSKQRDAASGKAVIWRSLNRQRKISFSTVQ